GSAFITGWRARAIAKINHTTGDTEMRYAMALNKPGAVGDAGGGSEIIAVDWTDGLELFGELLVTPDGLVQLRNYATGSLPTPTTDGLLVYDSTTNEPKYSEGGSWHSIGGGGGGGGGAEWTLAASWSHAVSGNTASP